MQDFGSSVEIASASKDQFTKDIEYLLFKTDEKEKDKMEVTFQKKSSGIISMKSILENAQKITVPVESKSKKILLPVEEQVSKNQSPVEEKVTYKINKPKIKTMRAQPVERNEMELHLKETTFDNKVVTTETVPERKTFKQFLANKKPSVIKVSK